MFTRTAILGVLLCAAAFSAGAENAQNDKMKSCNVEAKTQALKGDARKSFMKTCLSGKSAAAPATAAAPAAGAAAAAPASKMTPQQEKMKTCSSDAKTKNLKGADRKSYMKTCLSAGA